MYKKLYEIIQKREEEQSDLFKSVSEYKNIILGRRPHFIFSAENPIYNAKLRMSHDEVVDFLKNKGYRVSTATGCYGSMENSIVIDNPPKHSVKNLKQLSADLGQESSIYSDGYDHEMHFHAGENAGKHYKGQGTTVYKKRPEDFYTTLDDGTTFSHLFNEEKLFDNKDSMHPIPPKKMRKSENSRYKMPYIAKSEGNHPLKDRKGPVTLIHYSPQRNLTEIHPDHHGSRRIGAEAKQGAPVNRLAFYYLEGVKPEPLVVQSTKSKYTTALGNHKLYDVGSDPDGLWGKLKKKAMKKQINPGVVHKDDYHTAIKNAGYHGIYNSSLDDTMSNVVAMFEPMKVDKEHPIHPNDFHETSAIDFHFEDKKRKEAKAYAEAEGHHDADFLHKLDQVIRNDK